MAKSAKGTVKGKIAEIAPDLIEQALNALKDPHIRAEILQHGAIVVDATKQWAGRAASVADNIGDRFGQSGLEHRATRLRATVTALSEGSPPLAASLRPVTETLDEVGQMLKVSAALPFGEAEESSHANRQGPRRSRKRTGRCDGWRCSSGSGDLTSSTPDLTSHVSRPTPVPGWAVWT